jgi:hypothetical protein
LGIVAHFLSLKHRCALCLVHRCALCLGSLCTLPCTLLRTLPCVCLCCALYLVSLRTLPWVVAHFTLDIVPDAPPSPAPPWLCGSTASLSRALSLPVSY